MIFRIFIKNEEKWRCIKCGEEGYDCWKKKHKEKYKGSPCKPEFEKVKE